MKFTNSFIAVALLTGVIAAPLAAPSLVKDVAQDMEKREGDHAKADYVYREVYKRGDDEEKRAKADYVYREVYKRGNDEEKRAKADYVYREVYKRGNDEEKRAEADYVYRDVYKS